MLHSNNQRSVREIEKSNLLGESGYFSMIVPDRANDRTQWFSSLINKAEPYDFVFLDPDNGLEIKSKPYGTKNSSKFLFWHEVEVLWSTGKSILIYQHFIREKREAFIQRMLQSLSVKTPESLVEAFSTPHVVFLMALQPDHQKYHPNIVKRVQEIWGDQIRHWDKTS